jgi:hypothetical protein
VSSPHAIRKHDHAVRDMPADDAGYLAAAWRSFLAKPKNFRQAATLTPDAALTAGEQAALADVGFGRSNATARKAERARQTTLHAFFELATRESLSTQQAAERLGVASSRIRQRIKAGEILAFPVDGEHRIPAVQFHREALVPGLPEVLAALPPDIAPLEFTRWFTMPCTELENSAGEAMSPRDWLLHTGDAAAAVRAAAIA